VRITKLNYLSILDKKKCILLLLKIIIEKDNFVVSYLFFNDIWSITCMSRILSQADEENFI